MSYGELSYQPNIASSILLGQEYYEISTLVSAYMYIIYHI